jgi:RNA polymerase sigma factor (TIGR02999 family)
MGNTFTINSSDNIQTENVAKISHVTADAPDITELLQAAQLGGDTARSSLFEAVYRELKMLARSKVSRESTLTLLSPTSLVHESYERLFKYDAKNVENRKLFFGYASKVMRSVIVDYVRERDAEKRGGGAQGVTLVTELAGERVDHTRVLAVNEAMEQLKEIDQRCHDLVELRYFGGFSVEECAEALGISLATAARDWEKARAFLAYRLGD